MRCSFANADTHHYQACLVSRLCIRMCWILQGRMPADLVRALRGAFLVDPMAAANPQLQLQDFDWAGLGVAASGLHRTVPGVSCMLGPLEAQVGWCSLAIMLLSLLLWLCYPNAPGAAAQHALPGYASGGPTAYMTSMLPVWDSSHPALSLPPAFTELATAAAALEVICVLATRLLIDFRAVQRNSNAAKAYASTCMASVVLVCCTGQGPQSGCAPGKTGSGRPYTAQGA